MRPTSEKIGTAAQHLFERYGKHAVEIAKEYVIITARSEGARETDEALFVLAGTRPITPSV